MMADPESLALLRRAVDGFLRKSFDDMRVDQDGDFAIRHDGVTTWVQLRSLDEGQTAVLVWSASNVGLVIDAELTQHLACEGNDLAFGQFELHEEPPRIHISHALLGEFLSREELAVAVEAVAEASAHYGPILKGRFGGGQPADPATSTHRDGRTPEVVQDSAALAALRDKLAGYLRNTTANVGVDADGDFMIPYGSAFTWVRPVDWTEGRTLVRVWSITNVDLPVDGELTKFLLTANARIVFGGFRVDPSVPTVMLVHCLLGEYLNRDEFLTAVSAVATTADQYGPEIKAHFGGRLFNES